MDKPVKLEFGTISWVSHYEEDRFFMSFMRRYSGLGIVDVEIDNEWKWAYPGILNAELPLIWKGKNSRETIADFVDEKII